MSRWRIIEGDAMAMLPTLPIQSAHALVTDPPAGIGFMGKEWDDFRRSRNVNDAGCDDVFGRTSARGPEYGRRDREHFIEWLTLIFIEARRVLLPGAHALVWAIPRTSHWTAMALENAGYEIRDVGVHIFGQGFPKSLDVSKAIDKAAGATREVTRIATRRGNAERRGEGEQGATYGDAWGGFTTLSAPATETAKQWQGWGTALKPAAEHWILARKPLAGTVAANVQQYGTGAINIDACRIGTETITTHDQPGVDKFATKYSGGLVPKVGNTEHVGRWPANVTLDEEAAGELDRQSGSLTSGKPSGKRQAASTFLPTPADAPLTGYGDTGGASRFFYVAKPSGKERNAGAENNHPTVKPIALMQWLCRLITPPGGTVLDPFAGSGSTGIAALREGFAFVGIEQDADYCEIARRRIAGDAPLLQGEEITA